MWGVLLPLCQMSDDNTRINPTYLWINLLVNYWVSDVVWPVVSVSDTSGKVHSRSSQLSKSLDEVLHDKDALAYFISYLQSLSADNLVRFWLDVEAFRLAADRNHPAEPVRLTANHIHPVEPVQVATACTSTVESTRLAADQTLPPSNCLHVEKPGAQEDQACRKTSEMTQQRAPTNYCGHASSSASNSPKAVGRLPAHGEGICSNTDASALSSPADPHLLGAAVSLYKHCLTGSPQQQAQQQNVPSSSAFPSDSCRPLVDSCSASTPSITVPTQVTLLYVFQSRLTFV